jgi:hypothetical protein
MYTIELDCAEKNLENIVSFRKEICRNIGLDENGIAARPLNEAAYLFGYASDNSCPMGMIEFFMYDQLFESYSDAIYSEATDLEKIAPMYKMGHIRSVILHPKYQRSRLFLSMMAAMVKVAHTMGAVYMTAGTGVHNNNILGLHQNAGMKMIGHYTVDGSIQQLSLLDIEPLLARADSITSKQLLNIDKELIAQIRNRKKVAAIV